MPDASDVPAEVTAELQAKLNAINEAKPPDHLPPAMMGLYRHLCPARRNISTAIDLKELRIESDDGVYALLYREGTCKRCNEVARSPDGRSVISALRPPIAGRVGRS